MTGVRDGPLYTSAVLRPVAEQVAAALPAPSGNTVCDALSGASVLRDALLRVTGVTVIDAPDVDVLAAVADASCTALGCVLPDAGDAARVAIEARRIVSSGGRIAIAVWDIEHPPVHEQVLLEALRAIGASTSPVTQRFSDIRSIELDAVPLQDVVRFDGFAQYWQAMVAERESAGQPLGIAPSARTALAAACEAAVARYMAADGTLRIPVHGALLRAPLNRR